jgi:hypothetical protein
MKMPLAYELTACGTYLTFSQKDRFGKCSYASRIRILKQKIIEGLEIFLNLFGLQSNVVLVTKYFQF